MTQRLHLSTIAAEGMKALGGVRTYVSQSGLPSALIDLVYLRVSQINGCAYCVDQHSRDLIKGGMEVDKVILVPVWREGGGLFSERERAALNWVEAVTRLGAAGVSDEDFNKAASQFGEKELADLTIAIGLMNAYNRIAISLRLTPAAVKQRDGV